MADFLDEKRREIDVRLKELKPLVEEYHRLEAAAAALSGVPAAAAAAPTATARKPRAAARRKSAGGTGKRGRPKGSGNRRNEALTLVKGEPGITIPQIAEKMGIKQNYLYRVLPDLEKDGLVSKQGRGWFPKDAA